MLNAEKKIVDKEWVKDKRTLNLKVGGIRSCTLLGKENGNFGKKWTQQQKDKLSTLRKFNGKSRGSLNPKSCAVVFIDILNLRKYEFSSIYDAHKKLGFQRPISTIYTYLMPCNFRKLLWSRWVVLRLKDFLLNELEISELVLSYIENSNFKNRLLKEIQWKK